jgi:hypothetical protein
LPDEVPAGEDPVRDRAVEILSGVASTDVGKAA